MKQELQKKIFEKYPLLFGNKDKSMQETCMCWGLEVGDGWYKLIDELAGKLESMIKEFIKQHPDTPCNKCSCDKTHHYGSRSWSPGKCLRVKQVAFWRPWNKSASYTYMPFKKAYKNKFKLLVNNITYKIKNFPYQVYNKIVRGLSVTLQVFVHRYEACYCDKYEAKYPRASQVKEKFAGLRFYMDNATEEMYKIIEVAEEASYKICDRCGKKGETLNSGGWLHAACKKCFTKENKEFNTNKKDKINM